MSIASLYLELIVLKRVVNCSALFVRSCKAVAASSWFLMPLNSLDCSRHQALLVCSLEIASLKLIYVYPAKLLIALKKIN